MMDNLVFTNIPEVTNEDNTQTKWDVLEFLQNKLPIDSAHLQ